MRSALALIALSTIAAPQLLGGVAIADEKPAAKAALRTPPTELTALDFLAGRFRCKGSWFPTAGAPGQPKTSKISSKWALEKFFLTFDYSQPKTKEQPGPIVANGYWGWDADVKKYVHGAINSVGMSFMLAGDKDGDSLVFKGEGKGRTGARGPVVFTFKKADKGFTLLVEDTGADGKLARSSEETCTH